MLKNLLLSALLLSVFCLQGCSFKQFSTSTANSEDDIREAVFRYYFNSRYANGLENTDYIFLNVQNQDPSEQLLQRFRNHQPPVVPLSQAGLSEGKGIVLESNNDSVGVIFTISKIKWVSKYQVTVECQNTSSQLGVSGGLMKLKYVKDQWKVVSHSLIWISQNDKAKPNGLALHSYNDF